MGASAFNSCEISPPISHYRLREGFRHYGRESAPLYDLLQGVSYDSVLGVINRRIERSVNWSIFRDLKVIGMDEIALRKGRRDFVVIVTSRGADGEIVLLGALPDRKKEVVESFLRSVPVN